MLEALTTTRPIKPAPIRRSDGTVDIQTANLEPLFSLPTNLMEPPAKMGYEVLSTTATALVIEGNTNDLQHFFEHPRARACPK
jgi:hypothetical protein